ncbi:MAG: DUF1499 domain-containing protein [Planctomycetaceae bacterium]|nr:DUF1499 domain-containing protein [Planctomycetaceae bacterium]
MWIVLYVGLGLVVALLLAIALILVTHVEDWSRDLTINYAATSDDARDERLRPIHAATGPAELAAAIVRCVEGLPRWQLVERTDKPTEITLHFVRTTGLVGYKDDIRVRIVPAGEGSRLTAESQSRVGKGDLGQNPRNLRELLGAIRASLP